MQASYSRIYGTYSTLTPLHMTYDAHSHPLSHMTPPPPLTPPDLTGEAWMGASMALLQVTDPPLEPIHILTPVQGGSCIVHHTSTPQCPHITPLLSLYLHPFFVVLCSVALLCSRVYRLLHPPPCPDITTSLLSLLDPTLWRCSASGFVACEGTRASYVPLPLPQLEQRGYCHRRHR